MSNYANLLIRASAGTGKTFQLANRFISLLNSGAPADEILASTFTRKAAGEILDRVILRLAEAALDDRQLTELATFVSQPPLDRARTLDLLEQLIRSMHRLRICTLDSFFAQVASTLSLELGLPAHWTIIEEIHDVNLRNQAIESMLRENADQDVRRLMHLMTKGEAERSVGELLQQTISNLYGLYTQTTAESWQNFPDLPPLTASELDSTLADLESVALPEDSRWQNTRANDLLVARLEDWEQFIKRGIAVKVLHDETTFYRKPIPDEVCDVYQRLLRHARAAIVRQLADQTDATYKLLARFDGYYRRLKHDAHTLRFEDITRQLAGWTSHTDAPRDHFRLDARLAHLLLDEFQDTSMAQWTILRPLAERVTRPQGQQSFFWEGGQSSFFCVGDVKQAIYGWRGGRSEIFEALETQLEGLQHDALNKSYRSAPPVIDTVNRVFQQVTQHPNLDKLEPGIRRWCDGFEPHTTALTQLAGYAELTTSSAAQNGELAADVTTRDVAKKVADIVNQAPGRSIGVLARRNDVVNQLIFQMRRLGLEASEEGGSPLVDSAAVQLIMSLFKLADHPGDRVARFHLAQSPLGEMLGLTDPADDMAADDMAAALAARIRESLLASGYGPVVYHWSKQLARHANRRDRSRLSQLVDMAYQFQLIASLRTSDFLRYIRTQRVTDPTPADVRVMTIHQAKGLEFDIVMLADLDADLLGQPPPCVVSQPAPTTPIDQVCLYRNIDIQQLLPESMQDLFRHSLSQSVYEAMCVLYVALTRARHALHMVIAPSRRNERSLHKTFAGLLRASLTDGEVLEPEQIAYQHGDARWYESTPSVSADLEQPPATRQSAARQPIRLAAPLTHRVSSLTFTSPSALEGGQRVSVESVLRIANAVALSRGTLIHAWLECITWLDDGLPSAEQLRQIASQYDSSGLHVEKLIKQFFDMLESPEIHDCLKRQFYAPPRHPALAATVPADLVDQPLELDVYNARRFLVRDGDRMLSGTMDRLVVMRQDSRIVAADLIDFKTDAVSLQDADHLQQQVDFYRPQIAAYCRAVSQMFRIPSQQIAARLLFVTAGITREVSGSAELVDSGNTEA